MASEIVQNDILKHVNPEDSLYQAAKLTEGCITILNELGAKLELCWEIKGNEVCVKIKLSAFGQSISLGQSCLTVGQTTNISGHIDNVAKAEVEVDIQSNPIRICFNAKACVKPFVGGWHCATSGKHCINI